MKKNLLKATSLLLCLTLICTCFIGCGKKDTLTGTEAAKLLLANERLDAKLLSESVGSVFGTDSSKVSHGISNDFIYSSLGRLNLPFLNQIGTFQQSGNTYIWSNFGNYSNISSFFDSYKTAVESSVEQCTYMIDTTKESLTVTDKWVGDEMSALMLSVDETSDTVYERNEYGHRICKRSTNSEAQNVYEIYEYGEYAKINMLCIPGQRYEISLDMENGDLFLIMENSRGYWNMLCVSNVEHGANITNIMTSSGVSYVFDYYMPYGATAPESSRLTLITEDQSCDLIQITADTITLYPSGFNGISSLQVTADPSEVSHGDSSSNAAIMEWNGNYSTNAAIPSIVLANGTTINPGDTFMNNAVTYSYGNVSYVADGYMSSLDFHVEGGSITEKLSTFHSFLSANGITCKASMDSIIAHAPIGELHMNQFLSSYNWNGNNLSTGANISSAINVEKESFTVFDSMYEAVKDNELLSYDDINAQKTLEGVNFAALNDVTMGNVTFDNYDITVCDMSLTLSDMTLLEADTEYTIQLAYASLTTDAEGNTTYDPCSVCPFITENPVLTKYTEGNSFTVSQSATFNCYGILEPNTFHVVAYVATADGIRVSQLVPVIFSSDASLTETLPLVNLSISLNNEKNMVAVYEYNNDVMLELEETKDSYTYNEAYELLLNGVFNYGEPVNTEIEILASDTELIWEKVSEGENLSNCVIRMKYTKNTENGAIEGYIYATL